MLVWSYQYLEVVCMLLVCSRPWWVLDDASIRMWLVFDAEPMLARRPLSTEHPTSSQWAATEHLTTAPWPTNNNPMIIVLDTVATLAQCVVDDGSTRTRRWFANRWLQVQRVIDVGSMLRSCAYAAGFMRARRFFDGSAFDAPSMHARCWSMHWARSRVASVGLSDACSTSEPWGNRQRFVWCVRLAAPYPMLVWRARDACSMRVWCPYDARLTLARCSFGARAMLILWSFCARVMLVGTRVLMLARCARDARATHGSGQRRKSAAEALTFVRCAVDARSILAIDARSTHAHARLMRNRCAFCFADLLRRAFDPRARPASQEHGGSF